MKGQTRQFFAKVVFLGVLVLIAYGISRLTALITLPMWAEALLVFIGTKVLYDLGFAVFSSVKRFLFFEDYLREMLIFLAVAGVCAAGLTAVKIYMGGEIWLPILAAGLVFVWR